MAKKKNKKKKIKAKAKEVKGQLGKKKESAREKNDRTDYWIPL